MIKSISCRSSWPTHEDRLADYQNIFRCLLAYTGTEIEGTEMVLILKLISKQVFKLILQTLRLVLRFAKEFLILFSLVMRFEKLFRGRRLGSVWSACAVRFKRQMPTLQEFPSIRMEKAKCTVFIIWLKESRLFYRENHLFLQPILSNWWIRKCSGDWLGSNHRRWL